MNNLKRLLQDADPVRREAQLAEPEREGLRRRVLSGVSRDPVTMLNRARLVALAIIGIGVVGAAALGRMGWLGGETRVQAAVRFEVRLAEETPVPGLVVAQSPSAGRVIYLHPEIVVSNDDVLDTSVTQDGPEQFGIAVRLLPAGAERMRQATATHIGHPVAILIDGSVVAVPVVRASIGDSALVSGNYTRAEAERIANGMTRR